MSSQTLQKTCFEYLLKLVDDSRCNCKGSPIQKWEILLDFIQDESGECKLESRLTLSCTECKNLLMSLDRCTAKLDRDCMNYLWTMPIFADYTIVNFNWTCEGRLHSTVIETFLDSRLQTDVGSSDFKLQLSENEEYEMCFKCNEFDFMIKCIGCSTVHASSNVESDICMMTPFQSLISTSHVRTALLDVMDIRPTIHTGSDCKTVSVADLDKECSELRKLCVELHSTERRLYLADSEFVRRMLPDADAFRSCKIFKCNVDAGDVSNLCMRLKNELSRLSTVSVEMPRLSDSLQDIAEDYHRLQTQASWKGIHADDRNRHNLVDVRSYYIGLRAIEEHLATCISDPSVNIYGEYRDRSHVHQLNQIKTNNAFNAIQLSDSAYRDVLGVLSKLSSRARGSIAGVVVEDTLPLLHRYKVSMCIRGLLCRPGYKNVAFDIPRLHAADYVADPIRAQAMQDLHAMTFIDSAHRIIPGSVHSGTIGAMWKTIQGTRCGVSIGDCLNYFSEDAQGLAKLAFNVQDSTKDRYAFMNTSSPVYNIHTLSDMSVNRILQKNNAVRYKDKERTTAI